MDTSENLLSDAPTEEFSGSFPSGFRDVRVEIRTHAERIEGFIKIPLEAQNYCKRLSDILWYADRGGTGILTLSDALVYDMQTSKLITRQSLLGVAKSQVTYFWLLPQDKGPEPFVLELSKRV